MMIYVAASLYVMGAMTIYLLTFAEADEDQSPVLLAAAWPFALTWTIGSFFVGVLMTMWKIHARLRNLRRERFMAAVKICMDDRRPPAGSACVTP